MIINWHTSKTFANHIKIAFMRPYVLIMLTSIAITQSAKGQIFNQDAQGKSSIIGLGGTINVDINQSLFKANYYKTSRKAKALVMGIDVQGKNNEGLAGLLEGGNFSPSGEASILVGGKLAWRGRQISETEFRSYNLLFYGRIGIKGSEFKYDRGNAFTSVKTRFSDTTHIRPRIEFGTSFRWGRNVLLGLQLGFSQENNQSALNKSLYKYVIIDPTIPGLQQTKDITAYSGNYGTFSSTYFKFDGLYLIPVDSIYVVPSLYFRYNQSGDEALQQNSGVLGTSLNFINQKAGKFFGGVYVQSNDILKKDQKDISLYRKLEFGFIARFSFGAIAPF